MSSMPEGESVSMTAVPEARTWKLVFTAMPWPSLPSQSPESDCSFLKAAAECVPAHSGRAMDADSNRSTEYLRRVTDASGRRTARQDHRRATAPRYERFDSETAGMEAGVCTDDAAQVPFAFVHGEQECSICRRLVNQWEEI